MMEKSFSGTVRSPKPAHFFWLNYCSGGLYQFYWLFRQWRFLQKASGIQRSPFWRTFWSPILAYDFGLQVQRLASRRGLNSPRLWLMGISYSCFSLLCLIPQYALLGAFVWLCWMPILKVLREVQALDGLAEPGPWSGKKWILVVLGGLLCTWIYGIMLLLTLHPEWLMPSPESVPLPEEWKQVEEMLKGM